MKDSKRILVVEDDFLVSEKLCNILRAAGHDIIGVTASGKEAVEMTVTLQPDVVTMDLKLLDMDGLTAARQIAERCPTPIILLTAYETPELIAEASEAGVSNYLVKPIARGSITRAISIAMARFNDLQELRRLNAALEAEIAERKRAEEARERYAAELKRSNAEFQQFATIVSHDLKAPLRLVNSFLGLLRKRCADALDPKAQEYIQLAIDGVDQMKQLINALLEYARVDSRGQDPVPTEAEEVLESVLHILQFEIEDQGTEVTHDPLPTVLADPTQLQQLLQNLIGNALKFHDKVPPRIHIGAVSSLHSPSPTHPSSAVHSSSAAGQASASRPPSPAPQGKGPGDGGFCTGEGRGMWRFSVRDNGIGIAPKDQAQLFQVFQRLHTQEEYEGTGIGLATCKKIVERHGGQIWVESEKGKGATFFFTLPGV